MASWVAPAAPTVSAGGQVVGTPASMSPEQREGAPADARTDNYALGVLAAELLVIAAFVLRSRLGPPVSQPVFDVDDPTEARATTR